MIAADQLCDAACLGYDGNRIHTHVTADGADYFACADPAHRQRLTAALEATGANVRFRWQDIPAGHAVRLINTGSDGTVLMTFPNSGDADLTELAYANRARRAAQTTWDGGDAA